MAPPTSTNLSELTEVLVAIARLESKLDNFNTSIPPKIEDHENRLRLLEKARWPLPAISILISVAGVASAFIVK